MEQGSTDMQGPREPPNGIDVTKAALHFKDRQLRPQDPLSWKLSLAGIQELLATKSVLLSPKASLQGLGEAKIGQIFVVVFWGFL